MFFVAVFMSYAIALLLSLAFEMPIMNIDKIIFGGGEKRSHTKINHKRNPLYENNNVVNQKDEKKDEVNDQLLEFSMDNKKRNLSTDFSVKHTKNHPEIATHLLNKL